MYIDIYIYIYMYIPEEGQDMQGLFMFFCQLQIDTVDGKIPAPGDKMC